MSMFKDLTSRATKLAQGATSFLAELGDDEGGQEVRDAVCGRRSGKSAERSTEPIPVH